MSVSADEASSHCLASRRRGQATCGTAREALLDATLAREAARERNRPGTSARRTSSHHQRSVCGATGRPRTRARDPGGSVALLGSRRARVTSFGQAVLEEGSRNRFTEKRCRRLPAQLRRRVGGVLRPSHGQAHGAGREYAKLIAKLTDDLAERLLAAGCSSREMVPAANALKRDDPFAGDIMPHELIGTLFRKHRTSDKI